MFTFRRTTAFDTTVLNDLDRFHLLMDTIDRLPHTGDNGIGLKQQLKAKLIGHKQYICQYGEDLSEIRNWNWSKRQVNKTSLESQNFGKAAAKRESNSNCDTELTSE